MIFFLKKMLCLCAVCSIMAFSAPHIWDGSADVSWYEDGAQTYNLTTPEQLAGLAKLVNDGTSDFFRKTITLGADIFLNDTVGVDAGSWYENSHRNWVPIGTTNRPFKGEFDGLAGKNNRKIYGLYIKSASYLVGLFGYTSEAKISNIDILVGNISSEDGDVGACVGYATGGGSLITNVHAEGIKVRGVDNVGGLTGDFYGTITKSSFIGNVTGRGSIGGIAGRARAISKSYASGIIDGEGDYVGGIAGSASGIDSVYHIDGNVSGSRYVGGLVGSNYGSVLNSYSKGDVLGTGAYVGGLAGYVTGNVSNSHSEGNITGLSNCVGGLVGLLFAAYSDSRTVTWDIVRDSYSIGNVKGENYVGGLIGLDSIYRIAKNDYALIRKINRVSVFGGVEGKKYVGGIVGKMSYGYSDSSFSSNFYSELDSCHHAGGEVIGIGYVGGLLGYTYGSISNSYSKGDVVGESNYIGGVAGYVSGKIDSAYHIEGEINGFGRIGGLVGHINGSVSNSYSKGNVKGLGDYVGGLIGYGTDVQKSYVEGSVESDSSYVGGIAGYASGMIDSSSHIGGFVYGYGFVGGLTGSTRTILNSFSEGNVFGRGDYVGGLVGFVENVQNNYAKGAVESDSSYVGGLAGYVTGTIDSNYHIGGDVSGFSYVGGLLGYAANDVFNSHSEGNVSGLGKYIGGLVGLYYCLYEGSESQTWRVAPNSYSVGNVKGGDYVGGLVGLDSVYRNVKNTYTLTRYFNGVSMRGTVEGNSYVGGIVGKMNFGYRYSSASSNSYYKSKIDSCHHTDGDVNGMSYVGGLAGYINGSVLNSFFEGNVRGLGNRVGGLVGFGADIRRSYVNGSVESDSSYVGGVAGHATEIELTYHIGGNVCGFRNVGGLTGSAKTILNSFSEGNVFGGEDYVGGLVGFVEDIQNNYVKGAVKSDSRYVGGLAGYVTGTIDSNYHIGGDVSGSSYVGGVVGYTSADIRNSYSEGNIIGKKNYVGGIIGYSTGKIDSVRHIDGNVSGTSYVGGIVGYSTGKIDSVRHMNGNVSGTSYVGGLVGYTTAMLSNSTAVGNVMGLGDYVGGLVGLYYSRHTSSSAQTWNVVSNSTYAGSVKGANYVGGLVGLDSIYRDVDNTVTLTRNFKGVHAQGAVEGQSFVGGIVGKMNYGYKYDSDSLSSYYKSEIDSCYHTDGNVIGTSYVGGLSGSIYGFVSNSHSKGDVSGNGNYVGGLVGYGKYKIRKSYVDGGVNSDSDYVGGLVGYMDGRNYGDYGVDSSYHIGGNISGRNYIGGVVGYTSSIVKKSRSEGDVKGTGKYVGGLVGFGENEMQVLSCDAMGSVSSDSSYVGGLIGYTMGIVSFSSHTGGGVIGHNYVGGLVGHTLGDIRNSYSEGNVIGKKNYVGGLVGYTAGEVSDSHSEGDVTAVGNYVGGLVGMYYHECKSLSPSIWNIALNSYSSGNVKGGSYVGGLIGLDSIYVSSNQTYFSGTLTGKINNVTQQGSVEGQKYVGGIVGKMNYGYRSSLFSSPSYYESELNSCQHTNGDVIGSSYVGGLVGYTYGSISNSYSDGYVAGDSNYIGGLAGAIAGKLLFSYHVGEKVIGLDFVGGVAGSANLIRNSFATTPFVMGRNNVGGLSGYAADSVYSSYFEGDTVMGAFEVGGLVGKTKSAVVRSYSTANVKGDDNVGGLIGSAYWHVSSSYALGNVSGDVDNSSAGNDNLGGLVGYQYSGSISNSMALGNVYGTTKLGGLVGRFDGNSISKSYANGDVIGGYYGNLADEIGNYYIGGLVGYAKGSFTETYASGTVRGIKENPVYTGCIVGYVNGSLSITNSYYDKTKCDLGADGGENTASISGIVGKSTAEMYSQSTYENWDFVDTWRMMGQSYPFLQIYANSMVNAVVTTESLDGFVYDGLSKIPQVIVVSLFGKILTQGVDYSVNYVNNRESGSARISICGYFPYGGCKNIPFEIAPLVIEPSIAPIEKVVYTGRPLTPKVSVNNGENVLAITDYTVEYKDNINAGMATAFVHLKGNYNGSGSQIFTIEKAMPVINQMPTASDVPAGQMLYSSELLGGRANIEGKFIWKTPQKKPTYVNDGYIVMFVPVDTVDYHSVEFVVPLIVRDAASVVVRINDATLDSVVVIKGGSYILPVVPDSIGYTFVGFYNGDLKIGNPGDEIVVNENTIVDAVYEIKTFVVKFVNGDVELQSEDLVYGSFPEYKGDEPVMTATTQYTYIFKGWNPAISSVAGTATYAAVFDSVINKYGVSFKDYDGSILKAAAQYDYGTSSTNIVKPANPTRRETAKYIYTFKGWNPTIADVTENMVYTAEYDSTIRGYQIAFVNGNDELQSETVVYGNVPTYNGVVPTKQATAQWAYTFKGWNPAISFVAGTATYAAVFDSVINKYGVSFKDYDGSILKAVVQYDYGTSSINIVKPANPTRQETAKYIYTFKGWNATIADVTENAVYTAEYDSTVKKYTISFINGDKILQTSSIAYGEMPEYTGNTPTKASTKSYSYEFIGWSPKLESVTKETDYVAVFDSTSITGIVNVANLNMSIHTVSRSVQISAAPLGVVYALLDAQGRVLKKGRVESPNFNILIPQSGTYFIKVGSFVQRIGVK